MSRLILSPRRLLLWLALPAFALLLVLSGAGRPLPAYAAADFTVDTTADTVASPANTQVCNSPCSLRAALQAADNRMTIGGLSTTTIAVNAGTYNLDQALGALEVGAASGQVLNLSGTGTVIVNQAAGCTEPALNCMVLFLDPNSVGNFTAGISGMTFQGGHTAIGGGGIAGGSISTNGTTPGDNTTITDCVIQANTTTGGNAPGGGIGYFHGNLTITNSTITNNTSGTSNGGGIDYTDIDPSAGTLTISGSTISHNTTTQPLGGGGGGLHILGTHAHTAITGSTFDHNAASSSTSPGGGGAIELESGTLTVTNNTFTSNDAGAGGSGGAINIESGSANLGNNITPGLNRFAFNTAGVSGGALFVSTLNSPTVTAENNWWGTNTPTTKAVSGLTPTNFFALTLTPSPASIPRNQTSTLTADLTHNNHGGTPGLLPSESAIPVTWAPAPTLGSLSNTTSTLSTTPGTATATYTAGGTTGDDTVSVQVDGYTAQATVEIVSPPEFAKAFGASSIPLNGTTQLSFHLANSNTLTDLTGVAFNDTLPSGLTVVSASSTVCGGMLTVTAPSSISLSGATLAHSGGACNFSVTVTGTSNGAEVNTTGAVSATESGAGAVATATIDVESPPSIAKAFNPTSVALNATSSLTFTITNPGGNPDAETGVAFTDTLPTGLSVASSSSTVCGGTLTTTAPTSIALTGAGINTSSNCQFAVTVTGTAANDYTNTTGSVSSTNGGPGNTAAANATVVGPPQISKAFGAATIPLNGSTTLTIQISNSNPTATLTGVGFTDTLPAGLVVATPGNLADSCGGTATGPNGSNTVSLSGGTLAAGANCSVAVNVTGMSAGTDINTTLPVTSNEGGTGSGASASITVVAPPTISKAFGASSIPLGGSTSLNFQVSNPNSGAQLTGVGFSDALPGGLVVATPNGLSGSCGGGAITATAGSGGISLSGATLAAGANCTFSVNVTGTAAGTEANTTGSITSTEGGSGGTASASVNVEAPPAIAKSFNPSSIPLNGTTALTFTITNPPANPDPELGVAFSDTLPAGLTVASSTSSVCGGTFSSTSPGSIALTGATVNTNSTCQFSVTVTGTTSGSYVNTTGAVSSTNGGTGNTASASLSVASAPQITKAFGASAIPLNGTTSLTFTITNPNGAGFPLTGVGFTDSFPSGLVVATPSNLSSTCGGTATATAGAAAASLSGGSVAGGASCTVSLNVQGTSAGVKTNTSAAVTSNEGGPGNTASASITVVSITLSSSANPAVEGNTSVTYTATIAPTPPTGTVTFFDGGAAISGCSNVAPSSSGTAACNAGVYPTAGTHTITATYSTGPVTSSPLSEVVSDAALSATPGSNLTGNRATAIPASVVATFTDANPNGVAADFTASINWGDGVTDAGTVSAGTGGGFQVSGGHTYTAAGTFTVTVTITDTKGGATATVTLTATIAHKKGKDHSGLP